MSSSQLHRAVTLAQGGQRDEARAVLRQVVQNEPDNQIAWLWLASVAEDQTEYERALREVLRIDPNNAQAQSALSDFQQQRQALEAAFKPPAQEQPLPYSTPAVPVSSEPPAQPTTPPPTPLPTTPPPPVQPATPLPSPYAVPDQYASYGQPPQQQAIFPPQGYAPPAPAPRRRGCLGCAAPGCSTSGCGCLGCGGGCGCLQGCILLVVLFVLVPLGLLFGISYTDSSLGPFDWLGTFLPEEFGQKEIEVEADGYNMMLQVPRSWFVVDDDDSGWDWTTIADALDNAVPFNDTGTSWNDYADQPNSTIVETQPFLLMMMGDVPTLTYDGIASNNYECDALALSGETRIEYDNNLCGTRSDSTEAVPVGVQIFADYDTPAERHTVIFTVPVNQTTALRWRLTVPEDEYDFYDARIEALVESAYIEVR